MSVATKTAADSIRQLRADLGWTQQRLADEISVSRPTVAAWEMGTNQPSGPSEILLGQLRSRADRVLRKNLSDRA